MHLLTSIRINKIKSNGDVGTIKYYKIKFGGTSNINLLFLLLDVSTPTWNLKSFAYLSHIWTSANYKLSAKQKKITIDMLLVFRVICNVYIICYIKFMVTFQLSLSGICFWTEEINYDFDIIRNE